MAQFYWMVTRLKKEAEEIPLDLNLIFIHLVWKMVDKQRSAKSEPEL